MLALTCPHCHVENTQFSSVSQVSKRGGDVTVFFVCNACQNGVTALVRVNRSGMNPHEWPGDLKTSPNFSVAKLYPQSPEVLAPEHTPENIARFYKQAQDALRRKNFDSAGAMCRKTLDVATKSLDSTLKGDLKPRIDKLAETHKITPAMKEWAHVVRLDGNEAVHDEEPFGEEDAKQLASFTELFLLYAFTLPGMLAARQTRSA